MPPSYALTEVNDVQSERCSFPVEIDGKIEFIDAQHNRTAGTFINPGLLDIDVYEPDGPAEISWIYFRGNWQEGPSPGHPLDQPFNDTTLFTLDLVKDNDTDTVIKEVMPPTNATLFWKGSGPFHESNGHGLILERFDLLCKYQFLGIMTYLWQVPKDLDDSEYRLRLSTDISSSTQISGRFQVSDETHAYSLAKTSSDISGICERHSVGILAAVLVVMVMASCVVALLRKRSNRVRLT